MVLLLKEKHYLKKKSDDELPAGSGDDSSLSPLVIYGYLKMGDTSSGNGSINR